MTLTVTHVLKLEDKDSRWGGEALPSLKYIYRSIYIGFMKTDTDVIFTREMAAHC